MQDVLLQVQAVSKSYHDGDVTTQVLSEDRKSVV